MSKIVVRSKVRAHIATYRSLLKDQRSNRNNWLCREREKTFSRIPLSAAPDFTGSGSSSVPFEIGSLDSRLDKTIKGFTDGIEKTLLKTVIYIVANTKR